MQLSTAVCTPVPCKLSFRRRRHRPNPPPPPQGDAPSLDAHMRGLVARQGLEAEGSFCVLDLGKAQRLHAAWAEALPRVRPFYEVK